MSDPNIDLSMPPMAEAVPLPHGAPTPSTAADTVFVPHARTSFTTSNAIYSGDSEDVKVVYHRSEVERPLTGRELSLLREQGYPQGLAEELATTRSTYPLRFWVIDNSGSMHSDDGRQLRGTGTQQLRVVPCTRWTELQGAVDYHIQLAALLQTTTYMRLLNDPGIRAGQQEFAVGVAGPEEEKTLQAEVATAQSIISRSEPRGVTPLTAHVREIGRRIASVQQDLRFRGQQAVIVLATDGLPSDRHGHSSELVRQQFLTALESLQPLPVWIVIRLCTDDEAVVEYYNNLDASLELPLEVIDDFFAEGHEIQRVNKWLNYGLPLHRCREMGYHHRIFDLLDERLLNKDELVEFLRILFGRTALYDAPDPHSEWKAFSRHVKKVVQGQSHVFNPVHHKVQPWIDVKQLDRCYANSGMRLFRRSIKRG